MSSTTAVPAIVDAGGIRGRRAQRPLDTSQRQFPLDA